MEICFPCFNRYVPGIPNTSTQLLATLQGSRAAPLMPLPIQKFKQHHIAFYPKAPRYITSNTHIAFHLFCFMSSKKTRSGKQLILLQTYYIITYNQAKPSMEHSNQLGLSNLFLTDWKRGNSENPELIWRGRPTNGSSGRGQAELLLHDVRQRIGSSYDPIEKRSNYCLTYVFRLGTAYP